MKLSKRLFSYFLYLVFLSSSISNAASIRESAMSSRQRHPFGVYLGVFDPFPSLIGVNVGMNIASFIRFRAGYGPLEISSYDSSISVNTLGVGGSLFVPDWSFSPTIGFSWAQVTVIGGVADADDIYGFGATASHTYVSAGFDWQTGIGFNMGLGYNHSLRKGIAGCPYLHIGWYI
jgi:hypothetical protein